jgi:hypothetical protein
MVVASAMNKKPLRWGASFAVRPIIAKLRSREGGTGLERSAVPSFVFLGVRSTFARRAAARAAWRSGADRARIA